MSIRDEQVRQQALVQAALDMIQGKEPKIPDQHQDTFVPAPPSSEIANTARRMVYGDEPWRTGQLGDMELQNKSGQIDPRLHPQSLPDIIKRINALVGGQSTQPAPARKKLP